jgi:CubicO group peptidase (beta-lactamase class C family)
VDSILNRAYLHPRHDDIIVNDYPLTDEPGSRYEYSNATSDLVAILIERATGQRYGEWVSEQVLQPIGAPGGTVWTTREGGLAHAGCCILLPAEAWLRMAILLIQDGVWEGERLLPEGYVTEIRTPTPQNIHAGMGVYIGQPYVERRGAANPERFPMLGTYHSEPYLADDLFLYDGNANQVVYIVPSQNLIILRTGTPPPREPGWDNAYLPNLILRSLDAQTARR